MKVLWYMSYKYFLPVWLAFHFLNSISRCSKFYKVFIYLFPIIFIVLCILRTLCLFPGCKEVLLCYLLEDYSNAFMFFVISFLISYVTHGLFRALFYHDFNVLKCIETYFIAQCMLCLMNFEEYIFCSYWVFCS